MWDEDVAEYTKSSQNERSSLTEPSANFFHSEIDQGFSWHFNCAEDELCEINVHPKAFNIQAESVICTGHCKPVNKIKVFVFIFS